MATPVVTHHDARGRPIAVDHADHRSRRTFDQHGEIVTAWDARAGTEPTWGMGRDLTGRRLRVTHAASGHDELQVLDAAGESIWSRDADGVITRVAYDEVGRPVLETSDGGEGPVVRAERIYGRPADAGLDPRHIGRLVESRDAAGSRTFSYDWRGNVTTTAQRFWLTGVQATIGTRPRQRCGLTAGGPTARCQGPGSPWTGSTGTFSRRPPPTARAAGRPRFTTPAGWKSTSATTSSRTPPR